MYLFRPPFPLAVLPLQGLKLGDQLFRTIVLIHSPLAKGTLADILKQCGLKLEAFLEFL
jgi:hypothetical protein